MMFYLFSMKKGNDDNPDAGGVRIRDEGDFMRSCHEEENEIGREEEIQQIRHQNYQQLNKKDDDDDDENLPNSKKSEDYRLEIAQFNNDRRTSYQKSLKV